MVLISVDLPEPEGPQTTTTSPLAIWVEQSVSTCTGPYHLETFFNSIMARSDQRMMAILACKRRTRVDKLKQMMK